MGNLRTEKKHEFHNFIIGVMFIVQVSKKQSLQLSTVAHCLTSDGQKLTDCCYLKFNYF